MPERKPELVITGTLTDKHGRTVKVGYRDGDVEIIVTPHSGHDGRMAFDGEQRDRFIKAWLKAEMEIEREDAELEQQPRPGGRARRAKGRDVTESAARALIGIPDGL